MMQRVDVLSGVLRRHAVPCMAFVSAACGLVLAGSARPGPASDRTHQAATEPGAPATGGAVDLAALTRTLMGLRECTLTALDLKDAPNSPVRVSVPINGAAMTLDLRPHSIRDPAYEVEIQIEDGSTVHAPPGSPRTMRGSVAGKVGSMVAGSVLDDGLYATIRIPGEGIWWVEPVSGRVPGAQPGEHVVYANDAIMPVVGHCAVTDDMISRKLPPAPEGGVAGVQCPSTNHVTQLACDADVEYYQHWSSSVPAVQNRIDMVINAMNVQYEHDAAITHVISHIIVRTAEPDPYTATAAIPLLNQFRNHWLAQKSAVVRDVAMLFTGRDISISGFIGYAYGNAFNGFGEICTDQGFCIVQSDYNGLFAYATDLSAHELGHLWACGHCACGGADPATHYTMNSGITGANRHHPTSSIPHIINYRNIAGCLDCLGPGPGNNNCSAAIPISDGSFAFTTVDATTDGPPEASCFTGVESQVHSDVWYRYQATCSGQATASICGSSYNTRLAVYHSACPSASGQLITCNDDFDCDGDGQTADDGFTSRVSWPVMQNSRYLIRIGGPGSTEGAGTLIVTCQPIAPPVNDLCVNATIIGAGSTAFSTVGATATGPALPSTCDEGDGLTLNSDIWYQFQATCNGTLTVRTCSVADFDTRLAVYRGSSCTGLVLAGCNDDSETCSMFTSVVQITPVTCHEIFKIRLGSRSGIQGTGSLIVGCAPVGSCGPSPCPADLNGSGGVDTLDLGIMLSSWSIPGTAPGCGGAEPCAADINGDGVVNSLDLGTLLSAWGEC